MIPSDIQNQLALLTKTSVPPLIEVADSPLETPKWVPGQQFQAHVVSTLAGGRFQVLVDNQTLDMNLPRNTQPGEKLNITFVTSNPRLTFILDQSLPRDVTSASGSKVNLSDTAKYLANLLDNNQKQADETLSSTSTYNRVQQTIANSLSASSAPLTRAALPLIATSNPVPTILASTLREAIQQSGLFYESHQAQWVKGEFPLSSLLNEPQAKLPVRVAPHSTLAVQTANDPNSREPINSQTSEPVPDLVKHLEIDQAKHSLQAVELLRQLATIGNTSVTADPVHPQAKAMVQDQLETLNNQMIIWQGQAWPGQPLEWAILKDGSRNAADQDQEAPIWRTQLRLKMPSLGEVTARLVLDPTGVRIDFLADKSDAVTRMKHQLNHLADAMQSSGLHVTGLTVQQSD